MLFINQFFAVFDSVINGSKFTVTLIVWGVVITLTCAVTMSDVNSARRKLWSFVISAIGAVGIMLHLESFDDLSVAEMSTRLVMTNFVVMTLGGLGSGLLGVAIVTGSDKEDADKFRHALYSVLERIYIFVILSSLAVFVLTKVMEHVDSIFVVDGQLDGVVVTFWSALTCALLSAYRLKNVRADEVVGILLFLFLLVVLTIYANALFTVWAQILGWLLTLNALAVLVVILLSRRYGRKKQPVTVTENSQHL